MILVNPQLKKDYVYKDFKEMFPHLDKEDEYKQNGFYAYFSGDSENIIIETNINDAELLKAKTEHFIKRAIECTKYAKKDYSEKLKRCNKRLKTLKEAKGE